MKQVLGLSLGVLVALAGALPAHAAPWKPERNVELYIGSAAGGENDRVGRVLQKALTESGLIGVTMSVVNKPGAGQDLAAAEVRNHRGNPHYLVITSSGWLATQISNGNKAPLEGLTPIAKLWENFQCYFVQTESPIKDMADVKARLSKNPAALSIAYATATGSPGHISVAGVGQASGADPQKMRMVVFDAAPKAVTQVAGGHIEVGTSSVGSVQPLIDAGKLRLIGMTSPNRLGGKLAAVPTLREQGLDVLTSIAFMVQAPAGITPEQREFWEETFKKMMASAEIKKAMETNDWAGEFLIGAPFAAWFKAESDFYTKGLTAVGLLK